MRRCLVAAVVASTLAAPGGAEAAERLLSTTTVGPGEAVRIEQEWDVAKTYRMVVTGTVYVPREARSSGPAATFDGMCERAEGMPPEQASYKEGFRLVPYEPGRRLPPDVADSGGNGLDAFAGRHGQLPCTANHVYEISFEFSPARDLWIAFGDVTDGCPGCTGSITVYVHGEPSGPLWEVSWKVSQRGKPFKNRGLGADFASSQTTGRGTIVFRRKPRRRSFGSAAGELGHADAFLDAATGTGRDESVAFDGLGQGLYRPGRERRTLRLAIHGNVFELVDDPEGGDEVNVRLQEGHGHDSQAGRSGDRVRVTISRPRKLS